MLGTGRVARPGALTVSPVTPQGSPIAFRWGSTDAPDSAVIRLSGARDSTIVLRFDGEGHASARLDPGVYRWVLLGGASSLAARSAGGTLVVEDYAEEVRARAITLDTAPGSGGFVVSFRRARERLWLFGLVVLVLVAEWAWRLRRGLP